MSTKLQEELEVVQKQIKEIKEEKPEAESEDFSTEKFELQKRTINSLEVLKDITFEVEEWLSEHSDNAFCIKTLKLWFTLYTKYNSHEWTKIPKTITGN